MFRILHFPDYTHLRIVGLGLNVLFICLFVVLLLLFLLLFFVCFKMRI